MDATFVTETVLAYAETIGSIYQIAPHFVSQKMIQMDIMIVTEMGKLSAIMVGILPKVNSAVNTAFPRQAILLGITTAAALVINSASITTTIKPVTSIVLQMAYTTRTTLVAMKGYLYARRTSMEIIAQNFVCRKMMETNILIVIILQGREFVHVVGLVTRVT